MIRIFHVTTKKWIYIEPKLQQHVLQKKNKIKWNDSNNAKDYKEV